MEDNESPFTQRRGDTALMTIESARTRFPIKRTMTFGTNSIDVSDISGLIISILNSLIKYSIFIFLFLLN